MSQLPKCTIGPRHKWLFVKNVTLRSQTSNTINFSSRGKYNCNCGAVKYGPHNPNG